MISYKLHVLFYIDKVKINQKGQCPMKCRITYKKTRKQFSIGIFIDPNIWLSKKQKAFPQNKENTILNNKLSLIHQQVDKGSLKPLQKCEVFLFLETI
ncbi:Arm DNA-binding domain-containing protein [Polaribacter sp. L3A8]|uniref:Arm DNA-binding domain-containing protein n=1 Tax=Polaribacter sp. L3A8 TaxID=2686361 RepID=UPI00131ACFE3|nr:Arm DNA-binding domain-containing protein [Polaribacter sp. L3A8]